MPPANSCFEKKKPYKPYKPFNVNLTNIKLSLERFL
nr:MAG TPA: hypothetical protein [Caudoviricetes sp.]DAZ53954.1 MAG TPA: hypothetical protein [Caudoviricetes sp.]